MNFERLVYHLLLEDSASQERAAINILKKAKITNWEDILQQLKDITVPFSTNRGAKNNGHLPDLVKLYIDSGFDMGRLKKEYVVYMSIPKLNTKPLNRFQGKFVDFIGEIHATATKEGVYKGTGISDDEAVYSDENISVYLGDSMDKCIKYGKGDRYGLCISDEDKESNAYWTYRPNMSTYFVYFKKIDPERHPAGGFVIIDRLEDGGYSFNPVTDRNGKIINRDISWDEEGILSKYPEIKPAFDKKVFVFHAITFEELLESNQTYAIFRHLTDNTEGDGFSKKEKKLLFDWIIHQLSHDSDNAEYYTLEKLFRVFESTLENLFTKTQLQEILFKLTDNIYYIKDELSRHIDLIQKYDVDSYFIEKMDTLTLADKYSLLTRTLGYPHPSFSMYDFFKKHKIVSKDFSRIEHALTNRDEYLNVQKSLAIIAFGATNDRKIKKDLLHYIIDNISDSFFMTFLTHVNWIPIDERNILMYMIEEDYPRVFHSKILLNLTEFFIYEAIRQAQLHCRWVYKANEQDLYEGKDDDMRYDRIFKEIDKYQKMIASHIPTTELLIRFKDYLMRDRDYDPSATLNKNFIIQHSIGNINYAIMFGLAGTYEDVKI